MPLYNVDIFDDLPGRLDTSVNPYVDRLVKGQASDLPVFYGHSLKGKKGTWRESLEVRMGALPEKLVLEIGVHKGKVMKNLALDFPRWGFLGMDITFKRVVLSAAKLAKAKAPNAMILLGNAKFIAKLFEARELDGVIVFFPDPWTKKNSQLGMRLLNEVFCSDLKAVLRIGGFFWLKTDCLDYFKFVNRSLAKLGFEAGAKPFADSYESNFESLFHRQGLETFEGFWWCR